MTTYADILELKPIKVINGFDNRMFSSWHIFDDKDEYRIRFADIEKENRVKCNTVAYYTEDGYRTYEIGYLTFDNVPVFVYYGCGRSGRDSYGHIVFDINLKKEVEIYITSFIEFDDWEIESAVDVNEDASWILDRYGIDLADAIKCGKDWLK